MTDLRLRWSVPRLSRKAGESGGTEGKGISMTPWSKPVSYEERCSRGEEVRVVDIDNITRAGGKVKNRVTRRTIICQKTGSDGLKFQLTERQHWMCDDCNLMR